MKTLIYEPDVMRARAHVLALDATADSVDLARSLPEAKVLLRSGRYARLALRRGEGAAAALLAVARAANPDCVMVDLGSMRARPVSGPVPEAAVIAARAAP